jgi:hypothetical protein
MLVKEVMARTAGKTANVESTTAYGRRSDVHLMIAID